MRPLPQTFVGVKAMFAAAFFAIAFGSDVHAAKYTQISAGGGHTCAVVSTGRVHCWGDNQFGQLGNGTTADSTVPVIVRGIQTATTVSAGENSSCAILSSGGIRCWGRNSQGQLGNDTNVDSSLPVAVEIFTSASTISVGSSFACATEGTGVVRCWGLGTSGQLGNAESLSSATPRSVRTAPVSAGPSGVLGSVASVSAGRNHACALLTNGAVRCWGEGSEGQLGNGESTDSNIAVTVTSLAAATHVSAGNSFTCALLSSGGGRCWGRGSDGQLGNNSATPSDTPVTVLRQSGISAVVLNATLQLSAGGRHVCVLRTTPEMLCWGDNTWGQLGVGTSQAQYNVAVPVSGIGTPVQFSAGTTHTCAVFENGSAQCWGSHLSGQLGIGDVGTNNRTTPQWVLDLSCTLDVDDDGAVSALSDGLLMVRAMLGMSGTAVTSGLTGANATRPTWPQIRAHLSGSCGLQGLAP